jgi:hypothetical protein
VAGALWLERCGWSAVAGALWLERCGWSAVAAVDAPQDRALEHAQSLRKHEAA